MTQRLRPPAALGCLARFIGLASALFLAGCGSQPGPLATPYPTPASPLPTLIPGPPRLSEVAPPSRPSVARGALAYGPNCASCHAESGNADTAIARTLSPRPVNFHDIEYMRRRPPAGLYTSITKGVLGSAMPSFDHTLSEQQRWDVLFYVWSLHVSDSQVTAGAQFYNERCARCHGLHGERGLDARLDDPRFLAGQTGVALFSAVSGGLPDRPSHNWNELADDERWAIIEYVWTFMYDR